MSDGEMGGVVGKGQMNSGREGPCGKEDPRRQGGGEMGGTILAAKSAGPTIPVWLFLIVFFMASFLLGMNFGKSNVLKESSEKAAFRTDLETLKKLKVDIDSVMPIVDKRLTGIETAHNGLLKAVQMVTAGQEAKMMLMEKALAVQIGKANWETAVVKARKDLEGGTEAPKEPEKDVEKASKAPNAKGK